MNQTKKGIIITLILNIALPYLTYQLLIDHTSSIIALSVASLIPLLDTIITLVKSRKIDVFSSFIFLGMVLSVLAVVVGGDERFILLRESYVTAIMGCLFLGSLFFQKPLIYYFALRFTNNNPAIIANWSNPAYRNTFRLMTLVWGLSLVLEAVLKIVLVYSLSVSMFLLIAPFVSYGIIGLTIFWNVKYTRQVKQQFTTKS